MAELDARPEAVDVKGYAGDTLTIEIVAPEALLGGRDWAAEVRADRTSSAPPDAIFAITPPSVADGPAYLVLTGEQTSALLALGVLRKVKVYPGAAPMMAQTYTGQWDCQVSDGGADPITTLVQGEITIDSDVTRPAL